MANLQKKATQLEEHNTSLKKDMARENKRWNGIIDEKNAALTEIEEILAKKKKEVDSKTLSMVTYPHKNSLKIIIINHQIALVIGMLFDNSTTNLLKK